MDVHRLKQALTEAGVEIYSERGGEICLAERVRFHIMDSGVRVCVQGGVRVRFTVRTQRSDFPNASSDSLLERVRVTVGPGALERGYAEAHAGVIEVKDPMDDSKLLDVWHEITYEKAVAEPETIVGEVRWALELDKYVV